MDPSMVITIFHSQVYLLEKQYAESISLPKFGRRLFVAIY